MKQKQMNMQNPFYCDIQTFYYDRMCVQHKIKIKNTPKVF